MILATFKLETCSKVRQQQQAFVVWRSTRKKGHLQQVLMCGGGVESPEPKAASGIHQQKRAPSPSKIAAALAA